MRLMMEGLAMKVDLFNKLRKPFVEPFIETNLSPMTIESVIVAYSNLAVSLRGLIAGNLPGNMLTVFDAVSASLEKHMRYCLQPGHVERPVVPLITSEGVNQWKEDITVREQSFNATNRHMLAVCAFAGFFYETRLLWAADRELNHRHMELLPLNLMLELESYSFWKTMQSSEIDGVDVFGTRKAIEAFTQEQAGRLNQAVLQNGKTVLEMQELFNTTRDAVNQLTTEGEKQVSDNAKAIAKIEADITTQHSDIVEHRIIVEKLLSDVSTAEENINAFATALREELKVDATKKLWSRRAFGSAVAFWASASVIAFAIILPPYWAFTHIENVVSFLRRIGDAAVQGLPADAGAAQLTAATISRVVIVSAPLAMYFWAIKLIVRFNTRSMVLMDDARQRQTTMDTYFHLVENGKASPEERGLMLNALFKPLPGQGQENIDPPNFAELVRRPD